MASMAPLLKRATANLSFRPLLAAPSSLRSFTRSAELSHSGVDEEKLNMLERHRSAYFSALEFHRSAYFSALPIYLNQIRDVIDYYGRNHVEKSTLVIKGEGEKEADGHDEEAGGVRKYKIGLPGDLFKIGEIKAVVKNGELRELQFLFTKVKEDERKDVVEVIV